MEAQESSVQLNTLEICTQNICPIVWVFFFADNSDKHY